MQEGESWAITGPNGAGKSTLLSLLAGSLAPAEGHIEISVGKSQLFWQSPHVQPPPELRVRDIVEDWRRYKDVGDLENFYEEWQLPPDRVLYALSAGMRQRLFVALALSARRGLILLDEPTAFLDTTYRHRIHQIMQAKQSQSHLLLICATNEPEEVRLFEKFLYLPAYAE